MISVLHFFLCGAALVFIAVCRLSLVSVEHGLFLAAPSPVGSFYGLYSTGLVVVAHRLGCSDVCEIFPDQGLNPGPLPALTGRFLFTPPPVHRTISVALVLKGARGREKREARLCGPGKAACLFSKEGKLQRSGPQPLQPPPRVPPQGTQDGEKQETGPRSLRCPSKK